MSRLLVESSGLQSGVVYAVRLAGHNPVPHQGCCQRIRREGECNAPVHAIADCDWRADVVQERLHVVSVGGLERHRETEDSVSGRPFANAPIGRKKSEPVRFSFRVNRIEVIWPLTWHRWMCLTIRSREATASDDLTNPHRAHAVRACQRRACFSGRIASDECRDCDCRQLTRVYQRTAAIPNRSAGLDQDLVDRPCGQANFTANYSERFACRVGGDYSLGHCWRNASSHPSSIACRAVVRQRKEIGTLIAWRCPFGLWGGRGRTVSLASEGVGGSGRSRPFQRSTPNGERGTA